LRLRVDSCEFENNSSNGEGSVKKEKRLIITADDFGAATNINEGIEDAADMHSITCISVLSGFPESLPWLKNICAKHPEIGIGVHLNITTGKPLLESRKIRSLVKNDGNFYTLVELLPRLQDISTSELRSELRAQILLLVHNDVHITFISDQNGILTYYTPFFEVILELASEFHLAVRSPVLASVKYPLEFPVSKMTLHAKKTVLKAAFMKPVKIAGMIKYIGIHEIERKIEMLDSLGILHSDILIDNFWELTSQANYKYIIGHLPEGTSELIVHLGTHTRQGFYPTGLDVSYFDQREEELKTINIAEKNQWYNQMDIKKINYSDIPKAQYK